MATEDNAPAPSRLPRHPLDLSRPWQAALVCAVIVAECLVLVALVTCVHTPDQFVGTSYMVDFEHYQDNDQYPLLADALIHGRTTLDLPVAEGLENLDNPYDLGERMALYESTGATMYWDHAYYKGAYYCYFGVVPAVAVFMPYELVTGDMLATPWAVLVFCMAEVTFLSLLIIRIERRWFRGSAGIGMTVVLLVAGFLGSNVLYLAFLPNFYSVPYASGLANVFMGLWFLMGAKRDDGTLSRPHLVAGSVALALVLGCRPQLMAGWILVIPLFWDEIVGSRQFFSRKGLANTLCVLVPLALVALPILGYNLVRFGSWLDFGANYNLTAHDMVGWRPRPRSLVSLLFLYLFQPAVVTSVFPFVGCCDTTMPVLVPAEPSVGSVFALAPLLASSLAAPRIGRAFPDRVSRGIAIVAPLVALVVLVFDALLVGFSMRYYCDFCWLLVISATFVLLTVERSCLGRETLWGLAWRVMVLLLVASAFVQVFGLLADGRYSPVVSDNPVLYQSLERIFSLFLPVG